MTDQQVAETEEQDEPFIQPVYTGVLSKGKDSQLQTYYGGRINVLKPKSTQVNIEDIAVSISKLCRYNGHCSDFYSVAQHSVLGSNLAYQIYGDNVAKEFLLHDATESYVGDLVRPVKKHDPTFEKLEDGFWKAISIKYKLPRKMTKECKYIDDVMLTWEKRDLLPHSEEWPGLPDITSYNLPPMVCWGWEVSHLNFLHVYKGLFNVA